MILPEYPFEWQEGLYQQMFVNEAINNYVPSSWGVLKQSANYAFHDNSFVHAIDYIDSLTDGEVISEEQFKEKGYAESGVQYKEGMTDTQANVLQQMKERDKFYARYMKNTSMLSFGGITGMIAGSIPDPINYIPFVGWAGRISKVARIANKMPMLAMSANAMAGQTAFEVVKQTHLKSLGRDVNWLGAMADVGIAGVLGFGFGGLGKLSGLRKKIASVDPQTHQDNLVNTLTYGSDRKPFDATQGTKELEVPPNRDVGQPETHVVDNTNKFNEEFNQNTDVQLDTTDMTKKQQAIKNYNNCKGIS
tara:strand:- start:935 stop:1852 length:918 start_codon:yes stop_codon:yes gene_type:complete